jgi:transcription initiation factor TFIID subunit TAF12
VEHTKLQRLRMGLKEMGVRPLQPVDVLHLYVLPLFRRCKQQLLQGQQQQGEQQQKQQQQEQEAFSASVPKAEIDMAQQLASALTFVALSGLMKVSMACRGNI